MTVFKAVAAITATTFLSGCMGGTDDFTSSSFRTPNGNSAFAQIPVSLNNERNGQVYNSSYGGAAFAVGTASDGSGAKAYAGLMPGSAGGAAVSSGTVTYSGSYEVVMIRNININESSGFLSGLVDSASGSINLDANFNAGTLRGSGGNLTVDGNINGTGLSGDVTYRGVDGNLRGVIGDQAAVGAFHGNSDGLVYGGGFIVTD